ncbi:amidase [Streptomyces sp. ST1015]|uniref:amidase n=1 Tax=unclassified Streptomyces TaxID=2593676 RepID=UPI000DD9C8AF|nr:amidase [Streptomyces sp. ST1015]QZZ29543.1 amidase [Streptomyces sp. ST1015]
MSVSPPESAVAISAAVRSGAVSAVEVLEGALERLERLDPVLCMFREVWGAEAGVWARAVDARVRGGERLPLAGVPIAVKGGRSEWGALFDAGCVPVGRTAVPGAGTPWQTWGVGRHGRTVNPWRYDRTPGGSSAGSAVAVASGVVPLATGSDGAGSVRIPAAWCGVFGMKAGNGRLASPDRTGLAAPGFFAREPGDAAACWGVLSGEAVPVVERRVDAVWSADLGYAGCDAEPVAVARAAVGRLVEAGGVRLVGGSVVLEDPAEAWLAVRGAGGGAGRGVREVNDRRLDEVFRGADLVLTPVTPNAAHGHEGPGERYSTALTWAFNLSGHPAVSVPAGVGADGCPVGLQIVGRRGEEGVLLAVASLLSWRPT